MAYTHVMSAAPAVPNATTNRKQARLAVRLTEAQDALIREAAEASGQSLTEFVTTAALREAQDALADRRLFRIDATAWSEFVALLDRPARPIPELTALLGEPAPWDAPDTSATP